MGLHYSLNVSNFNLLKQSCFWCAHSLQNEHTREMSEFNEIVEKISVSFNLASVADYFTIWS